MTPSFTQHGGRLAQACAQFGGAPRDWLDLSTGINPNAWMPPAGLEVDWQRLPAPEALAALEAQAVQHFGCDPDLCLAVPGSETALRMLGRILGLPGLHRPPCYGTYRAAFAKTESLVAFDALPARSTVLTIGNPNNPDGLAVPRSSLLDMLDHQEQHAGWLIVDEAFADFNPAISIAGSADDHRRLIVLRSFGKFFGLAGVRLGFVIGPREVLYRLRLALGDWPLHAAALALGKAAYADTAWITQARVRLTHQAVQLDAMLASHGVRASGDCPLFRLIETPRANVMFERLASQHILTRPFADFPNLLRIGLPESTESLTRLDGALG